MAKPTRVRTFRAAWSIEERKTATEWLTLWVKERAAVREACELPLLRDEAASLEESMSNITKTCPIQSEKNVRPDY
jgi:hypothetical protein